MRNYKMYKFEEKPSERFGKLKEALSEMISSGSAEETKIGGGYRLVSGDGHESILVYEPKDSPKMLLPIGKGNNPTFYLSESTGEYGAVAGDGTIILIDMRRGIAASVFAGCRVTGITGIEAFGNSIKLNFTGLFGMSDYEERITVGFKARDLGCTGFEINEAQSDEPGIGFDDSSDEED